MKGYIQGHDWLNEEAMKYWAFPASTSQEMRKSVVKNTIFSGEYTGALKVDGYYQRLLKDEDGNCFMIARNRNTKGEVVNKIEWVPQLQEWMDLLPNGTCFLSEAYLPNNEGSKNTTSILGCLKEKAWKRQETTPLHFHIFDCMAWNGQDLYKTPYIDRIEYVKQLEDTTYVHPTEFFTGAELWEHLQTYLAEGREGMVIMKNDATVYNKRTPARVSIKIKQEIKETIDCVIIGANPPTKEYTGKNLEDWKYYYNEVSKERLPEGHYYQEYLNGEPIIPITKNFYKGFAGSLRMGLVEGDKVKFFCDVSGITEEMLTNWKDYVGKVAEIGGMMISRDKDGNYSIRHPKFLGIREDKKPSDCGFDQVK